MDTMTNIVGMLGLNGHINIRSPGVGVTDHVENDDDQARHSWDHGQQQIAAGWRVISSTYLTYLDVHVVVYEKVLYFK